jgi:erythronate-4-phosphate dehydrogenase
MNFQTPHIVVNAHTPQAVEVFSKIGNVVTLETSAINKESIRDADILIIRSETKIDEAVLTGSSVRFVGTVTAGIDHLDTDYLASKGIAWASAPGCNSNAVAEYVVAALLRWSVKTGETLSGKSLGVVGAGHVGSKVARYAQALGMNVLLNDPPLARTTLQPCYLPLDDLMSADFISLHVSLTTTGMDATYHFFDEERLMKMKHGAVLINTSRGAVVETHALRKAIQSGHLASIMLDVWEGEPEIDLDLLSRTFLATPHIAGYSLDAKLSALKNVYERVCSFLGINAEQMENTIKTQLPIMIPTRISDTMEIIACAVNTAYNIEVDDELLRKLPDIPLSERGSYFRKLRAEFRERREFPAWAVHGSGNRESAREILDALGFSIHEGIKP